MRFIDNAHKQFYEQMKPTDCYQCALFYLIGLNHDTRRNVQGLYGKGGIKLRPSIK